MRALLAFQRIHNCIELIIIMLRSLSADNAVNFEPVERPLPKRCWRSAAPLSNRQAGVDGLAEAG